MKKEIVLMLILLAILKINLMTTLRASPYTWIAFLWGVLMFIYIAIPVYKRKQKQQKT